MSISKYYLGKKNNKYITFKITYPLSDELTIKLLSSTMLALDKHRTGAV
jgi:hypothetical protein